MKLLRNEKGLTLVEMLATIVIGSLIVVFIMSVHIFIQKQFGSQKEDAQQRTDITIAVKEITKDIRSAKKVIVGYDNDSITIHKANGDTIIYALENKVLMKNNANYIYEINTFNAEKEGHKITIKIVSNSGNEIETEIVMREAGS